MEEDQIVEKVVNIMDDKMELSLSTKIGGIHKRVNITILTVVGMFLAVLLSNAYFMGKMDVQMQDLKEYVVEQKKTNIALTDMNANLKKELQETISSQMIIMANMKKLDPSFIMPFELRGLHSNNSN